MGTYDSPGGDYVQMPGIPDRQGMMTAPGTPSPGAMPDTDSAGTGAEAGTVGNSAFVVPSGGSLINGDRVQVSPVDVLVSTQAVSYGPQEDPLSGIGAELGQTGAGGGTVVTSQHPNAIPLAGFGRQVQAAREHS
jgi:hypothetical protein